MQRTCCAILLRYVAITTFFSSSHHRQILFVIRVRTYKTMGSRIRAGYRYVALPKWSCRWIDLPLPASTTQSVPKRHWPSRTSTSNLGWLFDGNSQLNIRSTRERVHFTSNPIARLSHLDRLYNFVIAWCA